MPQLDHILHRPVPPLDLALGLRMVRSTASVRHLPLTQVITELAREIRWAVIADRSFPTARVTAYLDLWIAEHGVPRSIQVDNGTEFTANEFDAWAYAHKIDVHFITAGRPVENAGIESFNGKLRDECLNANWFELLEDARPQLENWRTDYNATRPHSSLGGTLPRSTWPI